MTIWYSRRLIHMRFNFSLSKCGQTYDVIAFIFELCVVLPAGSVVENLEWYFLVFKMRKGIDLTNLIRFDELIDMLEEIFQGYSVNALVSSLRFVCIELESILLPSGKIKLNVLFRLISGGRVQFWLWAYKFMKTHFYLYMVLSINEHSTIPPQLLTTLSLQRTFRPAFY